MFAVRLAEETWSWRAARSQLKDNRTQLAAEKSDVWSSGARISSRECASEISSVADIVTDIYQIKTKDLADGLSLLLVVK